jgi:hypothetical protein
VPICVDPDAGTSTRGKGLRAETHPLDDVTIQLEETRLVLSRGMFGRPRYRASKPVVHVVGAGWRWDIPVGVPPAARAGVRRRLRPMEGARGRG